MPAYYLADAQGSRLQSGTRPVDLAGSGHRPKGPMSISRHEYTIEVHHEADGSYWATVPELPGCFASGDTIEELREALSEAISLYLHDDPKAGHITEMGEARQKDVVSEMKVLIEA
jgi:predicted RNase H-like HicB family nuclease